jgi:RsiW-degrading membrane proteinase PrsW (M82 family)
LSHDSWIAGCIEEPAKLIAAVLLAGRVRDFKWTLNGVLVGAAIGAGFGTLENVGYLSSIYWLVAAIHFASDLGAGNFPASSMCSWTGASAGAL